MTPSPFDPHTEWVVGAISVQLGVSTITGSAASIEALKADDDAIKTILSPSLSESAQHRRADNLT